MPAKKLFKSTRGRAAPVTDAVNEAGGVAYQYSDKHALAQLAMTGTLPDGGTFYTSGHGELDKMVELANKLDPLYVAKTAVYARENGGMKDAPALLLASLTTQDEGRDWFRKAFGRVVTSGKMLLGFTQIMRSGAAGRKSMGTVPRKAIRDWIRSRSGDTLFGDSVGGHTKGGVSLGDVLKMVHPTPRNAAERAIYAYVIGRREADFEALTQPPFDAELAPQWDALPKSVLAYEAFKASLATDKAAPLPKYVRWEFLTALPLKEAHWRQLALRGGWRQTLKNLNTYSRQGVFKDAAAAKAIADRLRDKEAIQEKVKPFPYEIMTAYDYVKDAVPEVVRDALHDAMNLATSNLTEIEGTLMIAPDLSGSMNTPVTGYRGSATTKATCMDIAALCAALMYKRNSGSQVLPFADDVFNVRLERRDSILTLAARIRTAGSGGTCVSAPLAQVNRANQKVNRIILLSDNESWVDSRGRTRPRTNWSGARGKGTELLRQFNALRQRVPDARMVCLDLCPYATTQAPEGDEAILNIGGWSNAVWKVITDFLNHGIRPGEAPKSDAKKDVTVWVDEIEAVNLDAPVKGTHGFKEAEVASE